MKRKPWVHKWEGTISKQDWWWGHEVYWTKCSHDIHTESSVTNDWAKVTCPKCLKRKGKR